MVLNPLRLLVASPEFPEGAHASMALDALRLRPLVPNSRARGVRAGEVMTVCRYKDVTCQVSCRCAENCGHAWVDPCFYF